MPAPVHNKRLTSIIWMRGIVCHPRAFEIPMTHEGQETTGRWGQDEVAVRVWCEDLMALEREPIS